jgi:hypothetical protein
MAVKRSRHGSRRFLTTVHKPQGLIIQPRVQRVGPDHFAVGQLHVNDNRLSPQTATPQKPLRSAGRGYSKRQARPSKGDRPPRAHVGQSRPRHVFTPHSLHRLS